MAKLPDISFSKLAAPSKGAVVLLAADNGELGPIAGQMDEDGRLARAIGISEFKGKIGTSVEVLAPSESIERFVVIGCGKLAENGEPEWMRVGGKIAALTSKCDSVTIICETGEGTLEAESVARMAAGAKLRGYDFDAYKTKDKKKGDKAVKLSFASEDAAGARKQWKTLDGVTDGVILARDLVNEPANILTTLEFAKRAQELQKLGVEIEILDEKALKKLKMNALLGVAQGSEMPPRVVVMKWNGGKKNKAPVAFVGKGVVFDTGGISIKPAASMEDMKGDMGGAAAVTGLMHALAARNAKTNAIGIIGLVENMPDGRAQRPGDIVTSMSGQTIEVINTDAEGRLVLADCLWYCQQEYKPEFMVNLATLTGAILVALGHQYAGLFSNNDDLSERLAEAGNATGEKVWRLPLGPDYDKLIDSKNADMKNVGGRWAGSITAGQFLQRFVNEVPWAHLDVAGTAMNSAKSDYSQSWASGYGVRLLDRLVADHYEK